jgi:hypothetical protein
MTTIEAPIAPITTVVEWARNQRWSNFAMSVADYFEAKGTLTEKQEMAIRAMFAKHTAKAEVAKPADEVTEAGFYLVGHLIYKVKVSEQGNLYAMRRDETGWVYERGAVKVLRASDKVTAEVAMEYGVRTGVCLFCNAELDDKDGYGHRVGVGPVCAKRHLGMTQKQIADKLGV